MILNYPNWGAVVWSIDAFFLLVIILLKPQHICPQVAEGYTALGIWLDDKDRIIAQSMYNHGSSNFYEKEKYFFGSFAKIFEIIM